tara:strand:- start:520 stop:678 length:159 start_codon:yes stop_codon:yes gene_type:complete
LHSEKVYEFDREGIQGISVIISCWPKSNNVIPEKAAGMDYYAQHHGDCPDEV